MKVFVLLLSILALVFSAVAFKNPICGLEHSKSRSDDGLTCLAAIEAYTYNAETNECIKFLYGGCFGNQNKFDTLEECKETCMQ